MNKRVHRMLGFTLVELMVTVAIIAILAAVVIPTFGGDDTEAEFDGYVRRLAQDMRRARFEAISNRDDRLIFIADGTTYTLGAAVPGQTTMAPLKQPEIAPAGVAIAGVLTLAADPGAAYTPPGTLPAEIRFTGTNTVAVATGASAGSVLPVEGSATVFLQTTDGKHRARIIVYGTTAYTKIHFLW